MSDGTTLLTVAPARELTGLINRETVRQATVAFDNLRSIILTGSLARDEGTFERDQQGWKLLGDVELLLVFHRTAALPPEERVGTVCRSIESALALRGLAARIGLSAVSPQYLLSLEPDIFAYELLACGRVIWGDSEVLALIPDISPADLRLEDAWRLLQNRIAEQLDLLAEPARLRALSQRARYHTAKLYLDLGTSLLVFAGAYAPTYRERTENLCCLAGPPAVGTGWPFPLAPFAERVAACCRYKVSPEENDPPGWELWLEVVDYARRLSRWELGRLTGSGPDLGDDAVWQRWLRMQNPWRRLRGWLYVARQQGWFRSWRRWPRWCRLAWRSSPRHLVYRASSELFFALPDLLAGAIRRSEPAFPLPIEPSPDSDAPPWRRLAFAVVRNYRLFVEDTRS